MGASMWGLTRDCRFLMFSKFGAKVILSVLVPILKARQRALKDSILENFEGGGSSRNIVHARGIGLKSGFRVTPNAGM